MFVTFQRCDLDKLSFVKTNFFDWVGIKKVTKAITLYRQVNS